MMTSTAFIILSSLILLLNHSNCGVLTPLRGWNSYDSYLGCVNETQVLENAEYVVKYLKDYGYEYIVVDGGWSLNEYNGIGGPQEIDKYGRPQPWPSKFPHSVNGNGFKWLSDQIHSMGLKFGVWVGRGISKTAINQNTPVYGTNNTVHAQDIYSEHYQCSWASDLYGLNMSIYGSQQFYDSLYSEFRDWGVDLIKYDCIFANDFIYDNIVGAYVAIEDSNHDFVYSLSPGNNPANISTANTITNITNCYRITGDTWDFFDPYQPQITYECAVISHFNITAIFAENNFIGKDGLNGGKSFPDLDMLPLGYISSVWDGENNCQPHKQTSLKEHEQRILFTLWSVVRSPLMFGGVVSKLEDDKFTLDLITNEYCLKVNNNSINNRQVVGEYTKDGLPKQIIWAADGMNNDYYVAFFYIDSENTGNNPSLNMSISFQSLGINGYSKCNFIEAWTNENGVTSGQVVKTTVNVNDTSLVYLDQCT